MISRSTFLHLRIPFSFYLMPVFFIGISQTPEPIDCNTAAVFLILHLLIYPASNGYNSYFDKDEGSIGGLENPPPVDKQLYWTALIFELTGILLAFYIKVGFGWAVFIYGLISKAYSHPSIRLKRYGVTSLLTVAIFQGGFTILMVIHATSELSWIELTQGRYLQIAMISSMMLLGTYPMTQIYQHFEDAKRGDYTFSLMLGIKGTFIFTMVVFTIALTALTWYLTKYYSWSVAAILHLFLFPVLAYFLYWFYLTWKDVRLANYNNTMRLNLISSTCLSAYFLGLIIMWN